MQAARQLSEEDLILLLRQPEGRCNKFCTSLWLCRVRSAALGEVGIRAVWLLRWCHQCLPRPLLQLKVQNS